MPSPLTKAIITASLGILFVAALPARSQAPSEERRLGSNPLADAQQRTEFARQSRVNADSSLSQAEFVLRQIDLEVQNAQKELDAARARQDKARKDVAAARSASAAAGKALEREAAELERVRNSQKQR